MAINDASVRIIATNGRFMRNPLFSGLPAQSSMFARGI
jgi:hypothetical protein